MKKAVAAEFDQLFALIPKGATVDRPFIQVLYLIAQGLADAKTPEKQDAWLETLIADMKTKLPKTAAKSAKQKAKQEPVEILWNPREPLTDETYAILKQYIDIPRFLQEVYEIGLRHWIEDQKRQQQKKEQEQTDDKLDSQQQ